MRTARRRALRLGTTLAVAACALVAGAARATTLRPLSPRELVGAADRIVRGVVVQVASRRNPGPIGAPIVTDVTVDVERVYRGGAAATLTLTLPGGTAGGETLVADGLPRPIVGERVTLFLTDDPGALSPVVGLDQGWRPHGRRRVPAAAAAFITAGAWRPGTAVTLQLHLDQDAAQPPRTLVDGSTSWDAVAGRAVDRWAGFLGTIGFAAAPASTLPARQGNGTNDVYWSRTLFDQTIAPNVLAFTTQLYRNGFRSEADVVFNLAQSWDSYRGPLAPTPKGGARLEDLQRVAIHEFGHALGLAHPDDAGQHVDAIMNSHVSDDDDVRQDDVDGIHVLYGGSGAAAAGGRTLTRRQCRQCGRRSTPLCDASCVDAGAACRRSCRRLAVKACRRVGQCPGTPAAAVGAP